MVDAAILRDLRVCDWSANKNSVSFVQFISSFVYLVIFLALISILTTDHFITLFYRHVDVAIKFSNDIIHVTIGVYGYKCSTLGFICFK